MPITSSAKKAMRQAKARTERNKPFTTRLKTEIKKLETLVKTDMEKAKAQLSTAYSVIDMAAKKHLIHKNTAARKKARMARLVAGKGSAAVKPVKKAASKAKASKTTKTAKKTTKKK